MKVFAIVIALNILKVYGFFKLEYDMICLLFWVFFTVDKHKSSTSNMDFDPLKFQKISLTLKSLVEGSLLLKVRHTAAKNQ